MYVNNYLQLVFHEVLVGIPRPKAHGHDGCDKVNTKAISIQANINLLFYWLLGFTLTSGFNQAIMGFTRPLWILLGHYGSGIMGCTVLYLSLSIGVHKHKGYGNNKLSQLIIII